jgi:hypothetical protein
MEALEAAGANEVKKAQPKVVAEDKDPDPKLAAQVTETRKKTEDRLNRLQTASQKFADIEDAVNAASQILMAAMNQYFGQHGSALSAYQMAERSGNAAEAKKEAKRVVQIRKTFLVGLKNANKKLDKLKKLEAKLAKQAEQEDKETAKKKAAEADAKAAEKPAAAEGEGEE